MAVIEGLRIEADVSLDEKAIRTAIYKMLYDAGVCADPLQIIFKCAGTQDGQVLALTAKVRGSRLTDL